MANRRNDYYYDDGPDDVSSNPEQLRREMQRQKQRRKEERRRRKYRKWLIQRIAIIVGLIVAVALLIFGGIKLAGVVRGWFAESQTPSLIDQNADGGDGGDAASGDGSTESATEADTETEVVENPAAYAVYTEDENTVVMSSLHRAEESAGTSDSEDGQASEDEESAPETTSSEADTSADPGEETYSFDQEFIDASVAVGFSGEGTDYVASEYAILVNVDTGKILLDRDARTRMSPASMTKVLTVLVAAEQLESEASLQDKVTITQAIVDECYLSDSSSMYYVNGDQIAVEELFYGAILPSGADAALALANYTAGSEEAFVQLMNDKLEELGLSETTHMTNPVGTYNEDHYSTAYDMAVIMQAAMDNEFCRKVLSAHTYQAAPSISYPNGDHIVSNWFLRRIEDKDTHGTVIGAKTGFVNESGCCAVSYQTSEDGTNYICCTADTWGSWRAIYDHVAIYSHFTN